MDELTLHVPFTFVYNECIASAAAFLIPYNPDSLNGAVCLELATEIVFRCIFILKFRCQFRGSSWKWGEATDQTRYKECFVRIPYSLWVIGRLVWK